MSKPKVFLTGGDGIGWALDDDLNQTRGVLGPFVEFTDLDRCEIVHSVWWEGLLRFPAERLAGHRIICHVPGEPHRYMGLPDHRRAADMVGWWVARSRQGARELSAAGLRLVKWIPYTVDTGVFRPLRADDPAIITLRRQYDIPEEGYLIGNFHRDTEGADLKSAKLMKGPDIFAEIVALLRRRDVPIHVLLAGPRRHWLRRRLAELGIPFTYAGQPYAEDDIGINILRRETLNVLYNLTDVYVVSSRSEGGPQSVLEAAAARCKIVSTPVGLAEDVLDPACIYRSAVEGANLIERDLADGSLAGSLDRHLATVRERHRPECVEPMFRELYADLERIPPYERTDGPRRGESRGVFPVPQIVRRARAAVLRRRRLTVCLWHKFFAPPYGGGNQFMRALRKALARSGVKILENRLRRGIGAYLLNSIHFDVDRFRGVARDRKLRVVHRIDGPIHLIRGFDREKDELCFRLNKEFASCTVVQSAWCLQRIVEMGYRPVSPVIIHNAVDGDIFHRRGRVPFDPERKVRLISSSWSDNPRKGGPTYKWIEEHLDWDRFEYTFVGRASEHFGRIRQIPPMPSAELADILRQHDIYITASRNDPCSNAVLEALACGLPVLYFNDGGHPELVGYGGLPFDDEDEILAQLDTLVANYTVFQDLIAVPSLDDVAGKYLTLLREAAGFRA